MWSHGGEILCSLAHLKTWLVRRRYYWQFHQRTRNYAAPRSHTQSNHTRGSAPPPHGAALLLLLRYLDPLASRPPRTSFLHSVTSCCLK